MYHFIVNPRSRSKKGGKLWDNIHDFLSKEEIPYAVHFTQHADHAGSIVSELTKDDTPKTIFLLGGDGTLNEMINGIRCFENLTIAYVPTGSANDFARGINLKGSPLSLVRRFIEHPDPISYSYGISCMDNKLTKRFLVSSGIGFDAAVCKEAMNSHIKNFLNHLHLGKLTYLLIAIKQVLKKKTGYGSLITEEHTSIPFKQLVFCSAHNVKYEGGGFMFCPDADPCDDVINYCIADSVSRGRVLITLPSALKGNHTKVNGISTGFGRSFSLTVDHPLPVHTDGEYVGDYSSISFSLGEEKLNFLH